MFIMVVMTNQIQNVTNCVICTDIIIIIKLYYLLQHFYITKIKCTIFEFFFKPDMLHIIIVW